MKENQWIYRRVGESILIDSKFFDENFPMNFKKSYKLPT